MLKSTGESIYSTEFSSKRFKCSEPIQQTSNAYKGDLNGSISSLDDSQSSVSSPRSNIIDTNTSPLETITNKLNSKAQDYSNVYNTFHNNYYSGSMFGYNGYENYANRSFQNYNNGLNSQQATVGFHQNQFYQSSNNLQNHQSQAQYKSSSISINNRDSIGSSANSSSASLSSPNSIDVTTPQFNNANSSNLNQFNDLAQQAFKQSGNNMQLYNKLAINAQNKIANTIPSTLLNDSSLLLKINPNTSNDENGSNHLPLKKRRAVPVESKDQSYWEKRRKNNESAKRSRDMRRSKEEHISMRVIYLEQENLQLRTEVALLRSETEKLRAMLYQANSANNSNANFSNTN